MHRRFALLVVLAAAISAELGSACSSLASVQERSAPPNILLILADDLGWHDVGFNGRREWETPNLDRLASEGTVFRRFYTACVVCAPSRAALLTGRYSIHNGVTTNGSDLPADEVTVAEALRDLGYTTGLVGKWHRGRTSEGTWTHPNDQGFDEFFGFVDARDAWEYYPQSLWRNREQVPVEGYTTDLFTEEAIQFLRRHRDEPFFLYLPYTAPHLNITAPEDEIALHRGRFDERDPNNPLYATYAAMVTRLDRGVGRVLDTLDELGLAENTLVVFTSDHGATFEFGNQGCSNYHDSNYPFRGHKRTLWEGGIRIPALARWPGRIPAGETSDAVCHTTDLLPTFLAAASGSGVPPVSDRAHDGIDLLPVWTGQAPPPERTLFWEWRSEGYDQLAALRGDLKLVVTDGRAELFNVVQDPAERRNVFAEHPELFAQLQDELRAWLETAVR